jgi:hypothetical protein
VREVGTVEKYQIILKEQTKLMDLLRDNGYIVHKIDMIGGPRNLWDGNVEISFSLNLLKFIAAD